MKRLFIFAMMTMAASSSFAMSDKLKCINGRVNVETYRHINESDLRMMVNYMVDDVGTFRALVTSKGTLFGGQRTFAGTTTDGRSVKFVVKNGDGLQGTLRIDGLADEQGFICKEQIQFINL